MDIYEVSLSCIMDRKWEFLQRRGSFKPYTVRFISIILWVVIVSNEKENSLTFITLTSYLRC